MSGLWEQRDRFQVNDDTTLDEVVIDRWLHVEEMDRHGGNGKRHWWVRLGDQEFDIESTRRGYTIYSRGDDT